MNRGNEEFTDAVNSKIYVDKTGMVEFFNEAVNTEQRYVAVSRPRRFGKSIAANMLAAYPGVDYDEIDTEIPDILSKINVQTKNRFIIIIDEWDCLFRDDKDNKDVQKRYIGMLMGLFKDNRSKNFLALGYITGILPIKKYNSESALNNFDEYSMIQPSQLAEYIGFTEEEVRQIFENSLEAAGWDGLVDSIEASEELLLSTISGDADEVARQMDLCHMNNTSILNYNNENALASCIMLAYYTARKDYMIVREFPSGYGFADLAFIPKPNVDKPAMIVELKWNW